MKGKIKLYCEICKESSLYNKQLHKHHIIPRSLGGSDKKCNLISLCPNCHQMVFIEGSEFAHSSKGRRFIIIKNKFYTSKGEWAYLIENENGEIIV